MIWDAPLNSHLITKLSHSKHYRAILQCMILFVELLSVLMDVEAYGPCSALACSSNVV